MRLAIGFVLANLFMTGVLYGQEIKVKELRGSYTKSRGLPARTIEEPDGREVHIVGMTFTSTTLSLRCMGRAIIDQQGNGGMGVTYKERCRWKLENQTLVIMRNDCREERYVPKSDGGKVIYLNAIEEGLMGYQREG